MQNVQTLKGFRDFLPVEARKRQYVINTLKKVFESYGFEPLETPALEYEEVLMGKYGEEGDKLMYRFTDNGDRKVALRYDQTVPLARVVAQYQNDLPMPFKRYQIQPVWRAENTQKGRFREFLQCDIDIAGTSSPMTDAQVVDVVMKSLRALGFKDFKVLINDRNIFTQLAQKLEISDEQLPNVIRSIDKLKKVGEEAVVKELIENGLPEQKATLVLKTINSFPLPENLEDICFYLDDMDGNMPQYEFTPTLARGLDYYTGLILEVEIEGYEAGSVGGGGRYDNLIGTFAGKQIPAVGFAFGFDRIIDAMETLNLFPKDLESTQVLVTIFSDDEALILDSIVTTRSLRKRGINVELWLDPEAKLEKQLKYADQKQIPYVIIIGPEEQENKTVTLKNLKDKSQETLTFTEAIQRLLQPSDTPVPIDIDPTLF